MVLISIVVLYSVEYCSINCILSKHSMYVIAKYDNKTNNDNSILRVRLIKTETMKTYQNNDNNK